MCRNKANMPIFQIGLESRDVGENFFCPIFYPLYPRGSEITNFISDQLRKGKSTIPATCGPIVLLCLCLFGMISITDLWLLTKA